MLPFLYCVTQHNRNGAVIVCWCMHSCLFSDFKLPLNLETQISLTSSLSGHVVLGQACHFPPHILNTNIPTCFLCFFLSSVLILAMPHTQKRTGAEREPPPSFSMKGESRKGGRRRKAEGEGNTIQTEQCLTSLPPKRGKDIQSQTEWNRKKRKREGGGNKDKKRKRVTVMYKDCISSYPQGTKHCVREWELLSSHTWRVQWGSRQTSVHLFLSPGVI